LLEDYTQYNRKVDLILFEYIFIGCTITNLGNLSFELQALNAKSQSIFLSWILNESKFFKVLSTNLKTFYISYLSAEIGRTRDEMKPQNIIEVL
jgi:hypothetical protein